MQLWVWWSPRAAPTEPDRFDLTHPGRPHRAGPRRPRPPSRNADGERAPEAPRPRRPDAKPGHGAPNEADHQGLVGQPAPGPRGARRRATSRCRRWSPTTRQGWSSCTSVDDVRQFNRTLPCGAKLLRTRRSAADGFVVAVFRLTERKNAPAPCGQGVGAQTSVAFEITGATHQARGSASWTPRKTTRWRRRHRRRRRTPDAVRDRDVRSGRPARACRGKG